MNYTQIGWSKEQLRLADREGEIRRDLDLGDSRGMPSKVESLIELLILQLYINKLKNEKAVQHLPQI